MKKKKRTSIQSDNTVVVSNSKNRDNAKEKILKERAVEVSEEPVKETMEGFLEVVEFVLAYE